MKNKLIHFGIAMGLPIASISSNNCTGTCGQCNFSCTPGIFMVIFLMGKMLYRKIWCRDNCHVE